MTIQDKLRLLYDVESQRSALRNELRTPVETHIKSQDITNIVWWRVTRTNDVAYCGYKSGILHFDTIPYEEIT